MSHKSYRYVNISAKFEVERDPGVAYISGRSDDNRVYHNAFRTTLKIVRAFAFCCLADDLP